MIKSQGWDQMYVLVDAESGEHARIGIVVDSRGEEWKLTGGRAPQHHNSQGKVWVEPLDTHLLHSREFYASVFGLRWAPFAASGPGWDI